jgi:hypothetical protein
LRYSTVPAVIAGVWFVARVTAGGRAAFAAGIASAILLGTLTAVALLLELSAPRSLELGPERLVLRWGGRTEEWPFDELVVRTMHWKTIVAPGDVVVVCRGRSCIVFDNLVGYDNFVRQLGKVRR